MLLSDALYLRRPCLLHLLIDARELCRVELCDVPVGAERVRDLVVECLHHEVGSLSRTVLVLVVLRPLRGLHDDAPVRALLDTGYLPCAVDGIVHGVHADHGGGQHLAGR